MEVVDVEKQKHGDGVVDSYTYGTQKPPKYHFKDEYLKMSVLF